MSDTTAAVLEFQSPTQAVIQQPVPLSGRATIWLIGAAIVASLAISSVFQVDRVVAVPGKVVSTVPNLVVQPLETAIVRWISVREGQLVHAGDLLARLDPTFVQADAGSIQSQVTSLQAEVNRLEAELNDRGYDLDGSPASSLQAMIFAQRHAEQTAHIDGYRQKIDSAKAKIAQTTSDIASYAEEFRAAHDKEEIRRQLEKLELGSKLNTLDASAQRADVNRSLQAAIAANAAAKSDLQALMSERDGYIQQTRSQTSQQLTEQGRKLADAKDQLAKATLRRSLVNLRADRDAVVLNVAPVSVGSVVQSGDALVTLVPTDAPLEVEASIPARDAGFVAAGNHAVIKFDTFPTTSYGYATGTLTTVSADSFSGPRDKTGRPAAAQPDASSGGNFFRGALSLDEMKLHNLPAGFRLTPGMPVSADIKVGKRTVMAYLLSRVVPTLTEGMREP